ncbi:MAG: isoprenylcysteine carboxylmethyltransferase family protein, partial [Vicinamibacterales bacterium]
MLRALAWLGGAVFVASLGYGVYFYAVVLAAPGPPTGPALPAALFDITLFTAFALHHSIFARTRIKRLLSALIPPQAERTAYVWIASLFFLALCLLWQPLPGMAYRVDGAARWLLYGAQVVGVALTWRAAAVIDPLDLSGIRQASGRGHSTEFRVIGPFRFVRHPIYLGWLLIVFAAPLMTMNRLLFATVSSVYLLIAIAWEERSLVDAFGERYRAYQREVRWR